MVYQIKAGIQIESKEDATELIQRYEGHEHDNWYPSVMDVVVRANEKDLRR